MCWRRNEEYPMTLPRTFRARAALTAVLGSLLVAGILAGCGGSSSAAAIVNGKGCKHIAFLLPESATAARWEAADHPDVVSAINSSLPGAKIDAPNAQGNATTQQTQADAALSQGACILVV